MAVDGFIYKLILSIVIGFILGLERQLTGHAVSFKTTVLIAVGSFIFVATEVGIGSTDARMAANVITGIGFLCSGVIFKNGVSVNGLTTAATLWTTSALAVLVGYGYIAPAIIGTAVVLVANIINGFADKKISPIGFFGDTGESACYLYVECLKSDIKKIRNVIINEKPKKIDVSEFHIETMTGTKCKITAKLSSKENAVKEVSNLCDKIFEKDVISVSYEECDD